MNQTGKSSPLVKLVIVLLLGTLILLFPISLPPGAGDRDLQAYWSSAYLFAHGEDFSDPIRLGEIERSLTTRDDPETLYSWFSPIGNVILLPFTRLPFTRVVSYWLIINILILFFSTLLIWGRTDPRKWIPLLAAFSFSMTVYSFVFGQINFMEVLGLALFLFLSRLNRPYIAGISLVLTTIKPHLVILTLPILLLDLLRKNEWKVLAGFAAGLFFSVLILFAFYPPWIQSFAGVVTSGMGNVRETPSITGLLVILGQYTLGKRVWPVALLGGLLWWLKSGKDWDRRTFIDISLAAGLIAAPVGWSYDQIMLLFPILSLLAWVVKGAVPHRISTLIVVLLILANLFAYLQHISRPSDVWFFWIPFFILGLYLFAHNRIKNQSTNHHMAVQATDI
jgi:hypothetical protein